MLFKRGDRIGITVAGGNGKGKGLDQLNTPSCIALDLKGDGF